MHSPIAVFIVSALALNSISAITGVAYSIVQMIMWMGLLSAVPVYLIGKYKFGNKLIQAKQTQKQQLAHDLVHIPAVLFTMALAYYPVIDGILSFLGQDTAGTVSETQISVIYAMGNALSLVSLIAVVPGALAASYILRSKKK